jgi:hypothetical protein
MHKCCRTCVYNWFDEVTCTNSCKIGELDIDDYCESWEEDDELQDVHLPE